MKNDEWLTTKGKQVKNKDLWMELDSIRSGQNISWNWVEAHAGHSQNERVDKLARTAAIEMKNSLSF